LIDEIFDYCNQNDVRLLLDKDIYEFLKEGSDKFRNYPYIIVNDDFEADLALSIGGDGTFLNTAARIGNKGIPILGINTGRLGFLADISDDELHLSLDAICHLHLKIEERSLLHIELSDGRNLKYAHILNDVAILKQDSSSMISIRTSLNGEIIQNYQADGLIISTPTGSTAYSLSVGGPILVPEASNILLSPIASHSLNDRPLVIPDNWEVDLEISSRSKCYQLSLDGRSIVLDEDVRVKITKSDYTIKVAKRLNQTFFDTLKNKLMWGVDRRSKW
jgi:NAD+ kinase